MAISLPDHPSVEALRGSVLALDARLAAVEADHAALRKEIAERNAAGRLESLEVFANETRALADRNSEALRAIFTVFHPEPAEQAAFALVATEAQHTLLHEWLDKLGGRTELPPDVKMR